MVIADKKTRYKKIFIIVTIIILLFLITIILIENNKREKQQRWIQQETERVKQFTSIDNFTTIEEVALYLNCKYIKQEDSTYENINVNIYMQLPINVENVNSSSENFVEKLIQYSAHALKYKNFAIIDDSSNTKIFVFCNEEKQLISTYYINNKENYYEKARNTENINNFNIIEPFKLNITSDILKKLIDNNWNTNGVDLGTAESYYRNYNIYFDEGIQIRKIKDKVFNIVFTEKYSNTIIDNLNVNSTTDEIRNTLGSPQFECGNLIGYKSNDLYVFFSNGQVSIYRVEKYETDKIAQVIQKKIQDNQNEKDFIEVIKNIWDDYDVYDYNTDFVKLQYTLKGMCIKYDSTKTKGVIIYNNYTGKILRKYYIAGCYKK